MSYGHYYQPPPPGPQMPQAHAHMHDPAPGLAFYSGEQQFYSQPGGATHLDGNLSGSIGGGAGGVGAAPQGWLAAFGTGGFEGEPPLLEGACTTPTTWP